MQKWLRDLMIVSTLMVAGALGGIYGGRYVYYNYIGNKDNISMMVEGFSAVILVNLVIYVYIILNHAEDFQAVFCNKREQWLKHDREVTQKLLAEDHPIINQQPHPKAD